MQPPKTAQMWLFADVNQDYGVPQVHQKTSHDTSFTNHSNDFRIIAHGQVPKFPDRLQVWGKLFLLELGRIHKYTKSSDKYESDSSADIYDFARHPGFKKIQTEDATALFGMDYTPSHQSFTMFPQRQTSDLSGYRGASGIRFDTDKTEWDKSVNNSEMDDWPLTHVHTSKVDNDVKTNNDGKTISQLRLAYIQQKSGRSGKMDSQNLEYRQSMQTYTYTKVSTQDMQITDPALETQNSGYCVTRYMIPGVSPNGNVQTVTERPPYFMFGVLADFEKKSNGVFPYNYLANLDVTYNQ